MNIQQVTLEMHAETRTSLTVKCPFRRPILTKTGKGQ
jgi:hypothetical protein